MNLEMAAERYRVEYRTVAEGQAPWAVECVKAGYGYVICFCWHEANANLIAAALNAAEDAGRRKAALEGLVDFITDIRASGDCGYFEINAQPGERFFQAAVEDLKAETKEATTNAE